MAFKTILFLGLVAICTGGALLDPMLGVMGYVGHYSVGPERQWWSKPIAHWGIRYSLLLAGATGVGIMVNWRKLRFGRSAVTGLEVCMALFLVVVWASTLVGPGTAGRPGQGGDPPEIKFAKLLVFLLMMTHVVTTTQHLNKLFWVLVVGSLILGLQAYTAPSRAFATGRIETVGGPDFNDANRLGGYMGAMLFLIGVQFLRSGWKGRTVCLAAGTLAANTVVLTRSRGAMIGVAGGLLVAVALAPKRHRRAVIAGLIVAVVGGWHLMDPGFRQRMTTITAEAGERDPAAQNRIEIWRGGWDMLWDHPLLGVGAGNFYSAIGRYAPRHAKRDAHNTLVRCGGELGLVGLSVLILVVGGAAWTLRQVIRDSATLPPEHRDAVFWAAYGVATALTAVLGYGMTGTLLYTEYFWWLLAMPICLRRVVENIRAGRLAAGVLAGGDGTAKVPRRHRPERHDREGRP